MKAFVFPGQGSQRKGMGAELFDEFPYYENEADTILGYGKSNRNVGVNFLLTGKVLIDRTFTNLRLF